MCLLTESRIGEKNERAEQEYDRNHSPDFNASVKFCNFIALFTFMYTFLALPTD